MGTLLLLIYSVFVEPLLQLLRAPGAAPAALPSRLCSSSRGTAHATNFGSLAPTHDFSEPQEVARIFHQAFSSTSTRTVISPPLLLSSGSHPNRLFTRMYTCTSGLHYRPTVAIIPAPSIVSINENKTTCKTPITRLYIAYIACLWAY